MRGVVPILMEKDEMAGGIYLVQQDGQLVEMAEQAYDSEDLLQDLLARYPNLLAGDQINADTPRRWLLISREMGVSSEEEGAERWSVDHLFVDQDGTPTIVEVKRSSDTRIRREVVGQMLDYAANAVVYWPIEEIRSQFQKTCEEQDANPDLLLDDFLESDTGPEQFWQNVKTNLQAGKLRLVFVSDRIPSELQRIVEFLNEQMDPAEALAIEIKQYVGEDLRTLVPRVIGQTAEAQRRKTPGIHPHRRWDEVSFLDKLVQQRGAEEAEIASRILAWAKDNTSWIRWGRGAKIGTFYPGFAGADERYWVFSVWTTGEVEIEFAAMAKAPPFDQPARRLELLGLLNRIPEVNMSEESIEKWPSMKLSHLAEQANLELFLESLDWAIQEIRTGR